MKSLLSRITFCFECCHNGINNYGDGDPAVYWPGIHSIGCMHLMTNLNQISHLNPIDPNTAIATPGLFSSRSWSELNFA